MEHMEPEGFEYLELIAEISKQKKILKDLEIKKKKIRINLHERLGLGNHDFPQFKIIIYDTSIGEIVSIRPKK